jgi:hypothetical protein
MLPRHDLRRCEVHGIEAGCAEAIDLHTGHTVAKPGDECRRARDIAAGLADRIDATEHNVIDQRWIELIAIFDGSKRLRRKIECGYLVQRAISFTAPARAADSIIYKCVGHCLSPIFLRHARSRAGEDA